VDFATDFKSLVELRDKMLIFLHENRRDYMPVFDGQHFHPLPVFSPTLLKRMLASRSGRRLVP